MNKIDFIRSKKQLSYKDIAQKTGLTIAYIQMLAKNKRSNPSLEAMQKIAIALNEKVERVFQVN
jgi:putative transcriptional regulator